jgi:hypothetical protein
MGVINGVLLRKRTDGKEMRLRRAERKEKKSQVQPEDTRLNFPEPENRARIRK